MPNDWVKGVFDDIESLTNEKLGEFLREFLKDYKEGALETNNWPTFLSGYTMAKTALNSYTRLLALKFPHVKTAMNEYTCFLSIDEGESLR
jgi:(+)-neomenthol dehydrogenase